MRVGRCVTSAVLAMGIASADLVKTLLGWKTVKVQGKKKDISYEWNTYLLNVTGYLQGEPYSSSSPS